MLDAHPEVVIANEFNVLDRWDDYKNIRNALRRKIRLFFDLHSLSRFQAMFRNRASFHSKKGHRYSYNIPGQWQGTYKTKIKVNDEFLLIKFQFISIVRIFRS